MDVETTKKLVWGYTRQLKNKFNMNIADVLLKLMIYYLADPFGDFRWIENEENDYIRINDDSVTYDCSEPFMLCEWYHNIAYGPSMELDTVRRVEWTSQISYEISSRQEYHGFNKSPVIGFGIVFNGYEFEVDEPLSNDEQRKHSIFFEINGSYGQIRRTDPRQKIYKVGEYDMKSDDKFAVIIERNKENGTLNVTLKVKDVAINSITNVKAHNNEKIKSIQLIASISTDKTTIKSISIDYKRKSIQ